jgi:hypothetical protein
MFIYYSGINGNLCPEITKKEDTKQSLTRVNLVSADEKFNISNRGGTLHPATIGSNSVHQ